ncbi:CDP-glycerol glycerophosphotransferase family protein, partial [Faecalibacillus intestinalis]|uniref:CDP-glycerol glycerophosphotransferase family protein n=1 Tax=Faecalibacillus intestinalis TaxID=1982626 RepID=UPI0037BE8DE2
MHEYFNTFNIELPKNVTLLPRITNIQNQLINCKLLITDYSSVCWDMLFMAKPVLFFQFDIDRYE